MNNNFITQALLILIAVISAATFLPASASASSRVADCPSGYTNTGLFCSRGTDDYSNPSRVADCPRGYTNMGATCFKPPFDSKGMSSMSCPQGWFRTGGRCYQNCRSGYTSMGETCHRTLSTLTTDSMTCRTGEILDKSLGRCYLTQKPGESCSIDSRCGKGFKCQPLVQKCVPDDIPLNSSQACSAFKIDDLSTAARDARATMSYGGGSALSAGGAYSQEIGTVYGQNGEFGCYVSVCTGGVSDVSIADFATLGLFNNWNSFSGYSFVTSQGASIPFVEVGGFTTAQSISQSGSLLGSLNTVSLGVGLIPVQVGLMSCYTHVIDGNQGISQIRAAIDSTKIKAENAPRPSTSTANTRPSPPVVSPQQPAAQNNAFVRIQNRWKGSEYLNIETGPLQSAGIQPGWYSARWILEQVPNTSFVRLKNYWKQDQYIHNQNGRVEIGTIQPGWWSAMWTLEAIPNTNFYRIQNRWKPNEYLHNQNGYIESGSIQPGWWSAMWIIQ